MKFSRCRSAGNTPKRSPKLPSTRGRSANRWSNVIGILRSRVSCSQGAKWHLKKTMEIEYGPARNGSVGCRILLGGRPRLHTVDPFLDG